MKPSWQLSRRHFLRGLGAAVALPSLDVMTPVARAGSGAAIAPTRLAFFFVPNGVNMEHWTPKQTGSYFDLPTSLAPLAPVKRDLLVLSGLTHDKGRKNDDGEGDHARSAGVFLTGSQLLKSEGAETRVGVSVDQYAAAHIGSATRFASLELGTETGRPYGKCDAGYSCGYSANVAWRDETTPVPKLVSPRDVFERLFSNEIGGRPTKEQAMRLQQRKSILDYVLSDAKRLHRDVSIADKPKLDQYLTSIREIERRIEESEKPSGEHVKLVSGVLVPQGTPEAADEHLRLLGDMLVLAFQTDVTRVCSFMFANAASNRAYREVGIKEGHHSLSHHKNREENLKKLAVINRFHVEQFAYILQRLKATPDGDGDLLDNSLIVYGSGLSDGNSHSHDNLPVILAGNAGGSIRSGRHLQFSEDTPLCNLFNSMLDRARVPVDLFGDSTDRLRQIDA